MAGVNHNYGNKLYEHVKKLKTREDVEKSKSISTKKDVSKRSDRRFNIRLCKRT